MQEPKTSIDKSNWPRGPWDDEPDRVEFEHAGLPCLMIRHPRHGNYCGYAAVPPGHPLHGKDYDTPEVDVHGGLTYADKCQGDICHVPKPGEPEDVWWFGFDCAHGGDRAPGLEADLREAGIPRLSDYGEVYRDLSYVRAETEKLAEQLARVSHA